MAFEPATQKPLKGPFNRDSLRLWVSDTEQAPGNTAQVVLAGDFFDELLFGNAEEFKPLVGKILDANKQYRFRHDLVDDLSISVINLPNGKMIMGVINPVKADAKFLIDGYPVVLDPIKPTMVIGIQTKDDLDNTGRGLFIASQASDLVLPPKILTEPQGGAYLEGDVADVIATALGYKDVIAIKNGDVLDGIKAAALPVPILSDTADIYVFGFVHPKDPNLIAWTKPASIRCGPATPAKIVSQSQSESVEVNTEVTLDMDVVGTPPPECFWIPQVNGVDGRPIRGKRLTVKALYQTTYIPKVVNRYKAGAGDMFDPNGTLKEFIDRGDAVTIKPIKDTQPAPNPIAAYNNATDKITLGALLAGKTLRDYRVRVLNDDVIIPDSLIVDVGDRDLELKDIEVFYAETDTLEQSPSVFNTQVLTSSLAKVPYNPALKQNVTISNGTVTKTGANAYAADNVPVQFLQAEVVNVTNNDGAIIGLDVDANLKPWDSTWIYFMYPYHGEYLLGQSNPTPIHFSPAVSVMAGDKYSLDIKPVNGNQLLVTATVTRADKSVAGTYEFPGKYPIPQNFYAKVQPFGEASGASVANVKYFPA